MRILIAGASGMVGRALVEVLKKEHELILVGRDEKKLLKQFPGLVALSWTNLKTYNQPTDVVIHLSGQNIGDALWTQKLKKKLIDSRVNTVHLLLEWMKTTQVNPPRVLAANAIGYYGCQSEEDESVWDEHHLVNEQNPRDFIQKIAIDWQNAWKVEDLPLSICWMRFGVVLKKNQGMLKKLWPSFFFGAGAILGHGKQVLSWIYLDDLVAAILWLLQHPEIQGPVNMVSPQLVTQAEFAKSFADVLHRPLFFRMPSCLVELLFGEMGRELLLSGQRIVPKRLLDAGFKFRFANLDEALKHDYNE